MSNLQTILVSVFLAFFVFAVLMFSGLIKLGDNSSSSAKSGPSGKVVIWGTFPSADLSQAFDTVTETNRDLIISYIRKDPATYEQSLIESFASGTGPDIFVMSPEMIKNFDRFIYKIPYASYPSKTFTDSFIDGASIYLTKDGALGFPIAVDPTVLYYNKNIFSNAGLSSTPDLWDELFDINSKLTKTKNDGTILQSMIALGKYDNIQNAKDIIATLMIQSGNDIVSRTDVGYESILDKMSSFGIQTDSIFNFFTSFSNPSLASYSWNSALPNSFDMFTSGKLAMYVGKASELFKIQSTNPNLSFDVKEIMQTRNTENKRTYGKIYALSISKNSKNLSTAFGSVGLLSSGDGAKSLASAISLPPALRSLLAKKPEDAYMYTFFNSAIFSRAWLDPDAKASDAIFSELIQNIVSGKMSTSDAIAKANNQIQITIGK